VTRVGFGWSGAFMSSPIFIRGSIVYSCSCRYSLEVMWSRDWVEICTWDVAMEGHLILHPVAKYHYSTAF
jgi:hypothetical protein